MPPTYEPDETPEVTTEMAALAERLGMHIIGVVCEEPGDGIDDPGGVAFAAITPFLPRRGDRIELEDGRTCEVTKNAHFKLSRHRGCVALVPNVYAVLIEEDHG